MRYKKRAWSRQREKVCTKVSTTLGLLLTDSMTAGLVDHMTLSGSAEQLALDLAKQIAQVSLSILKV